MYTLVSDAILGNALLGMWKLKKWGVYLGVLSVAIDNVFGNIPLIQSHKFNYDQILVDNLLANSLDPLWFIAIKRKWHLSS
jgi:uncharacterized membrane protein (DUF2068 family)